MSEATIPTIAAETPTQGIVKDANRVEYAKDSRGRKIGAKRLNMQVRRRVLKALTTESAAKAQYLGLAALAACCVEIDGDPVSFPSSEMQIDALIDRLEDEGLECIGKIINEHFTPAGAEDLKNS